MLILCVLAGCSDDTPVSLPPIPPPRMSPLTINYMAALEAGKPAVFAPDDAGNLYWTQPHQNLAVVFFRPPDRLSQPTTLTDATVRAALGIGGTGGSFESLWCTPDGSVIFTFAAEAPQVIRTLGRWRASTGVQILADTAKLEQITNFRSAMALTRMSLVSSGKQLWLWVRHFDRGMLLAIDPSQTNLKFFVPSAVITEINVTDESESKVSLSSETLQIGPGEGALYLHEPKSGIVWRFDPSDSTAAVLLTTQAIPETHSSPVGLRDGRVMFQAAMPADDVPPFDPNNPRLSEASANARYPALLVIDPETMTMAFIDSTQTQTPSNFAYYAARIERLIPDPTQDMAFFAQDLTSGQLLRLVVAKDAL